MARPHRRRAISFIRRAYSHDPYERVEAIGGINSDRTRWSLSQTAAITAIETGTDEFFMATEAHPVKVIVATISGQKYLRTEREETHPDELLQLPAG